MFLAFATMACAGVKKSERTNLIRLEREGYSVFLDSTKIQTNLTYLNSENVSSIKISRKQKIVHIFRKEKRTKLYSIADLIEEKKVGEPPDWIILDSHPLDSVEVRAIRYEKGAFKYIRHLTQKDYQEKEFDSLPQVRQSIGNGILIILTSPFD